MSALPDSGPPPLIDRLLPEVYERLRRLAHRQLAGEGSHTLNTTALVHEVWLNLVQREGDAWTDRAHFFGYAAIAMRHILVDNARRKLRAKHGGNMQRLDVDEIEIAAEPDDEKLLLVHEALDKLAADDPIKAEMVKLHYFVGLTHAETAQVLNISEKTVRRHWKFARVWLYQAIKAAR